MITIAHPDSDLNTSLGRWVARFPAISDLLEEYGLNYCCRGHVSLQEACWQRQLDAPMVLTELRLHQSSYESPSRADWLSTPLRYLCDHIEIVHHTKLRTQLSRITSLVEQVERAHANSHPELSQIQILFHELQDFFVVHLLKEEWVLFPRIRQLENTGPATFRKVSHGVHVLQREHDTIGRAFDQLRDLTVDYRPPPDACQAYVRMLNALHTLEIDIHRHVHKENHILFPRALTETIGRSRTDAYGR